MADQQDPAHTRALVTETPLPGLLLGRPPLLLPAPADPEVGWTTTDDDPEHHWNGP